MSTPSQSDSNPTTSPPNFRPTLLLIDVQNDFLPPHGTLPVPHGDLILPAIHTLLTLPFRLTVLTRDSHPPNHISFAPNHPPPNNVPFVSRTLVSPPANLPTATHRPHEPYETQLWPAHCVRDTPGWNFPASITAHLRTRTLPVVIVDKGMDPLVEQYGAFEDPFGRPGSPDLAELLKAERTSDLYVVGVAGDFCVRETVLQAARKGEWRIWVVEEGVASVDGGEGGWGRAKEEMLNAGGRGRVRIVGLEGAEVAWVKGKGVIKNGGKREKEDVVSAS